MAEISFLQIVFFLAAALAVFVAAVVGKRPNDAPAPNPVYIKLFRYSLFIVAGILVILSAVSLSGFYFFAHPTLHTPYLTSIKNPTNTDETMYVNILLKAEIVSAQRDLFADVKVYPNVDWRNANHIGNSSLPRTLLIVFDGAVCKNESQNFTLSSACNMMLTFNPSTYSYTVSHNLNYTTGGDYGIFLVENKPDSRTFTPSNSPFIQIESYQVTNERTSFFVVSVIGIFSILATIIVGFVVDKRREP